MLRKGRSHEAEAQRTRRDDDEEALPQNEQGISPNSSLHVGNHRTRLAVGDIHGYLRLFQYPCTSPRAEYREQKASSSAVTAIRFLFEDSYLLTVGGADATLIRWKLA